MPPAYRVAVFISALLAANGAFAATSAEIEQRMRGLRIDRAALDSQGALHAARWVRLTAFQRENLARGTIVGLDMETADSSRMFRTHTNAVVQCMDSEGHGMSSQSIGTTIQRAIAECAAKSYRRLCPMCRNRR